MDQSRQRVAILVVDGYDKRGKWGRYSASEAVEYPWIDLCLREVERRSQKWDYEVLVFDNAHLENHRALMEGYERVRVVPGAWSATVGHFVDRLPHRGVLRVGRLLERSHPKALDYLVRQILPTTDYLVTLDTDSFPVHDDWLDVLIAKCQEGATIAGVYRDEMAPKLRPFIHVSGLCTRPSDLRAMNVAFGRRRGQDVGQNLTEAALRSGRQIAPLRRSNSVNFHFLIGGIYGDVIYHNGAGSRRAKFHTPSDLDTDEQIRVQLRDAAFRDVDHLMAILRGQTANDLELRPI
jgi:hypothetical protein